MMEFVHVELKTDNWITPVINVNNSEDAVAAAKQIIQHLDRESVISIHTMSSGRVINASVCAIGTMTQAIISPAEIIRTALLSGAPEILLIHNHPSGNEQPSREDLLIAQRLATACTYVGIALLDFIIVGVDGEIYSLRENDEEWLKPLL